MQGDLVFDEKGKVTGRRVLDATTMEVSFETKIKVKGVDGVNMGTYTSTMMPDGSMYGQGQGCVMSNDGQMVTWKGNGMGKLVQNGKIRFAGAIYLSTQSKGSLAPLNNVAVVFEHEGDMEGNVSSKGWEWK
ncbi:hypothetical protein NTE_03181 [Candidatus Nitrososphaera evergladensis SR1]|jgi:hypothetical protein|uniref:Uncharacterized protein n=1 Tax=Candidatus Nitrososphaera evergladensis SR1 TaxID=1459636 RepID=A0A075MU94_9ARCH|nr:hypothetical protein [Candidatus Nitrososphaera evergladensis]AIF85211.1 hypothetical protein NTE_03181 [Candidatus Nitrososphaera evergladensis SR1]